MEKQKKITQYDYIKAMSHFEPFIRETDKVLKSDEYIVLHFDGVGMTKKHLSKMNQVDKKTFSECLVDTAQKICKYFSSARLAYVCNDEISLLLDGSDIINNHHNRIQKLVSIAAAKASTLLLNQLILHDSSKALKDMQNACIFAVKCYNLPQNLVNDYFKTRLLACKKSIFDHNKIFEEQEVWEQYGYLITYEDSGWKSESIDFVKMKLVKKPQKEHYALNRGRE